MPEIRDEEIERVNKWIQTLSVKPRIFSCKLRFPNDVMTFCITKNQAYELLMMLKDYKRFLVGNMRSEDKE